MNCDRCGHGPPAFPQSEDCHALHESQAALPVLETASTRLGRAQRRGLRDPTRRWAGSAAAVAARARHVRARRRVRVAWNRRRTAPRASRTSSRRSSRPPRRKKTIDESRRASPKDGSRLRGNRPTRPDQARGEREITFPLGPTNKGNRRVTIPNHSCLCRTFYFTLTAALPDLRHAAREGRHSATSWRDPH